MKKILCIFFLLIAPAYATMPNERLSDPALEQRAETLMKELRCMVCQNQSIDESDAPLARDLRMLVREQIAGGKSDAEIRSYLVARYGEFVLLRPNLRPGTYLLWFAPLIVLLAGLGFTLRRLARQD